jgi:hypothetical protein
MAEQNRATFGIFRDRTTVEHTAEILRRAGFRGTDISALFPENEGTKDLAFAKCTKSPEGTAAGMSIGGVVGGTIGWLAASGVLAIPALVPYLVAGPIVDTLAGVGLGAVVGGFVGALIGMGRPEYEARRYQGQIRRGSILMSVHCDSSNWVKRAKSILKDVGAEDIASAGEARADFANSDRPMARAAARREEDHGGYKPEILTRERTSDEKSEGAVDLGAEALMKRSSNQS